MLEQLWNPALYTTWCYSMFFLAALALSVALWRESRRHARRMRCRVCGQTTRHVQTGVQVFPGHPSLALWHCTDCRGTRSEVLK